MKGRRPYTLCSSCAAFLENLLKAEVSFDDHFLRVEMGSGRMSIYILVTDFADAQVV